MRAINPSATIIETKQSMISPKEILNIQAFDANKSNALHNGGDFAAFENLDCASESQKGLFHIETDADGKLNLPTKKKKRGASIGSLCKKSKEAEMKGKDKDAKNDKTPNSVDKILDSSKVSTVSLTTTSPIDLEKFNMWITQLLQENGNDIYRFKGILAMQNYDQKFVVQGTMIE